MRGNFRRTGSNATVIAQSCWRLSWTRNVFEEPATALPIGFRWGALRGEAEWIVITPCRIVPRKTSIFILSAATPGSICARPWPQRSPLRTASRDEAALHLREKQRRIDQLLDENSQLKAQLRYRDNKQKEGLFGSSTPSAQRPLKANTEPEQQSKREVWPKAIPGMDEKASMKVMRLESSMWVWMRLAPTVTARWKINASVTGRY